MELIYLSETEKALLLSLKEDKGFELVGISNKELGVAAVMLEDKGLIKARVNYDEIIDAAILAKGEVYVKGNPTLENPVSDNELKRLQKEALEYKLKIIPTIAVSNSLVAITYCNSWNYRPYWMVIRLFL